MLSCETELPIDDSADENQYPINIDILSSDGININANFYEVDKDAPFIVLCHQARFNKYEYAGIAERLNDLGFNCIAIDQRSGGPIADKQNWTNVRALEQGKSVDYLDAEQDIQSAVNYVNKMFGKKVILWGSSYSSTLVLYVALENENVSSVISFSPGDYFTEEHGSLTEKLAQLKKPMFVTSSLQEADDVKTMLAGMKMSKDQVQFVPKNEGYHGSRALWKGQPNGDEYWKAIEDFLKKLM